MESNKHQKGWGTIAVSSMVAIALIVMATTAMLLGLFLQAYGKPLLLGLLVVVILGLVAGFVWSASDHKGSV